MPDVSKFRPLFSEPVSSSSALQSLLEPFSKLLSFVIQYGMFSLSYLVELCGLCYKAFNKVLHECVSMTSLCKRHALSDAGIKRVPTVSVNAASKELNLLN